LEDYYAILGLDPGASQESIKVAYRRLARESHPDRNIDSSESERSVLSLQMAQLNGAYAVLSDAARRREYDEHLRILGQLSGNAAAREAKVSTGPKPVPVSGRPAKSNGSHRVQPSHDADSTLVLDFSKQIRSNLLANRQGFTWKETVLEGFDWGLESVSWAAHYCVGGRGFADLDTAAAKKFANYSQLVITRCNRPVRKSHFLFMLPFQNLSQWESVSAELNRLVSAGNGESKLNVPVGLVLFDLRRGRTMRVGMQLKEKPFEKVLLALGPELMNPR
jgi:curved DNA-binding protein CbpA